ncbi:MAG: hypothetical protein IJ929_09580 [Prevotella sp.]|nr:hypothetical protein [Prevotella sp.]
MKRIISVILCSMVVVLMSVVGSSQAKALVLATVAIATDDDDRGDEVKLTEAEKYAEKMPEKRSAGKGVAPKESMARQLARLDARANFAEAISAAVTSAAKDTGGDLSQYAGDDEEGMNVEDAASRAKTWKESISREIINNTIEVKKNVFYNKRTRKYTVYVCLEYNGEVSNMVNQVVKNVRQKVSDKDRKRIEANLDAFEQEIEAKLKTRISNDKNNE